MQSLWNANGAQRRRRILIDESSAPGAAKAKGTRATTSSGESQHQRHCYDAVALDGQPRVTDLIPRKRWVLALFMLAWLLQIGGIVYVHTQLYRWSDLIGSPGLSPLDLSGFAGIATWFSSATLLLAAIGSLQVYNVRRHKTDDYRGTYRLWFWTSAWLVLASLETTAGLRPLVRELADHVSGPMLAGGGDIWWMLIIGLPSLALGTRLSFEMRTCKAALVSVFAAGLAYLYAALFQLGYIPLEEQLVVLHRWTAVLMAHFLTLATIAIYARHVLLDAERVVGKATQRRRRKRKSKQTQRVDAPQETPAPAKVVSTRQKTPRSSKKTGVTASETKSSRPTASTSPAKQLSTKRKAKSTESPSTKKQVDSPAEAQAAKQTGTAGSSQTPSKKSKQQKRVEPSAPSKQQGKQPSKKKVQNGPQKSAQRLNQKASTQKQSSKSEAESTPVFTEIEEEQTQFPRLSKADRRKMRKQRRSETRRAA